MKYDPNVYGYVNGKPTYSRDEFIFTVRGFGPIENDVDLLAFAEKVTSRWYNAGWHQTFATYYLSDYALSEPGRSLTVKEFNRLKELQQAAREAEKAADDAREWKLHQTIYWADNSVEEICACISGVFIGNDLSERFASTLNVFAFLSAFSR